MNSEKQILKSTLYIAVVITYTIIQDWSVMAFFLILYFLPKLFLNGYQIYHISPGLNWTCGSNVLLFFNLNLSDQ